MRLGPLALLLMIPAQAGAQAVGDAAPREVLLRSGAPGRPGGEGRLGLTFTPGPGFSRAGLSGLTSD